MNIEADLLGEARFFSVPLRFIDFFEVVKIAGKNLKKTQNLPEPIVEEKSSDYDDGEVTFKLPKQKSTSSSCEDVSLFYSKLSRTQFNPQRPV